MSTEQNKQIVRNWVEQGWNAHNLGAIDQLFTADFAQHCPQSPITVNNIEDLKDFVNAYFTGLPDLQFTIEDLIAEGDKVVWRFTALFTQTGSLFGIPPTGRSGNVSKIVEAWLNLDDLGVMQALGVIPTP